MRLEREETAVVYATTTLKMEEWVLLSTYHRRRIARLKMGRIPLEIKEEWLAAADLSEVLK